VNQKNSLCPKRAINDTNLIKYSNMIHVFGKGKLSVYHLGRSELAAGYCNAVEHNNSTLLLITPNQQWYMWRESRSNWQQ
jgi:hypothetical protein